MRVHRVAGLLVLGHKSVDTFGKEDASRLRRYDAVHPFLAQGRCHVLIEQSGGVPGMVIELVI